MDDIDRFLGRNYEPSDEDVVKARSRTVGVQEYHFTIPGCMCQTIDRRRALPDNLSDTPCEDWIFYDVGGSRTSVSRMLYLFDEGNTF